MSTKLESFNATKPSRDRRKQQVLDALWMAQLTRAEITGILQEDEPGLRHSSVTARVHELLAAGKIVVCGEKWDAETKRNVEVLEIAAPPMPI